MRDVLIFQPIKSPMQSGRERARKWQIAFSNDHKHLLPQTLKMTIQKDPQASLNLAFNTLEDAVAYAEKHHLSYHIQKTPPTAPIKPHTYTEHLLKPHLRS